MLSRIMWISVAGIALIAGIAMQDGDWMFGWNDRTEISSKADRTVEARVDRAIERGFEKMEVVGSDGVEIEVPAETKRAMADAVGRLVKAEADLAMARIGEDDEDAIQAAQARRNKARADIDRLKVQMQAYERAASSDNDALREEIRREIQEDVRASVRDAVGG